MRLAFKVYVGGLFAIIILTTVLFFSGFTTAAALVGQPGTLAWIVGAGIWIVLWDSRSRWPGQSAWQRFVNVITFTR